MPLFFEDKKGLPQLVELGIHSAGYRYDYKEIAIDLQKYTRLDMTDEYLELCRYMGTNDLFFLMYFILDMPVNHPFLVQRIYDAQDDHNLTLDLWARDHWKSTILTTALPIWQFIQNPEERICLFSHTRAAALAATLRECKSSLSLNRPNLEAGYVPKPSRCPSSVSRFARKVSPAPTVSTKLIFGAFTEYLVPAR
jgi:hypothetical protein